MEWAAQLADGAKRTAGGGEGEGGGGGGGEGNAEGWCVVAFSPGVSFVGGFLLCSSAAVSEVLVVG